MINEKRIVVVMPAYNAEKTLEKTHREIPFDIVDDVIIVDDYGHDSTVDEAGKLGIQHILVHDRNRGYGSNQKSCYRKASGLGAFEAVRAG